MKLIKGNIGALIVCFIVGIFTLLPSVSPLWNIPNFSGVWPELNGDRLYYFARIEEVIDGHKSINHPYFYEHKDVTYPQATLAERLVAFGAKSSNRSVPDFHVYIDFVSAFLSAFLVYLLLRNLGVGKRLSWIVPLLFFTIVHGPQLKPIHPAVSFPLFLVFLICWVRAISCKKKLSHAVVAGLILGLLFLTYFYHWSFLLVVLGIYGLILLIKKKFNLFSHQLLIVVVGLIVGAPYFWLILKGLNAEFYDETMVRVGVYFSHLPETIPRLIVALFWFSFFSWWGLITKLFNNKTYLALWTLLAANIVYPNHQIITGMIIQNANHWSVMPVFIYLIVAAYIITITLGFPGRKFATGIVVLTIFLVAVPIYRLSEFSPYSYIKSITQAAYTDVSRQEYQPVFDWLNKAKKDSVVFAHSDLMEYIPAYTHSNVYYTWYAFNLPGSDREIIERALLAQLFNQDFFEDGRYGLQLDTRILWTQPSQSERNTHKIHRLLGIPYEEQFSLEKEIKKIQEIHGELQVAGWGVSLLKKYKIDYIVWDKEKNPEWKLDKLNELIKVEILGNFEIYRFK